MVTVRGCGQQDGSFGEGKNAMDTLYRLLEDDPHSALNAGQTAACSPIQGRSGPDLALGQFPADWRSHAALLTAVLSLLLACYVILLVSLGSVSVRFLW